jgi:transcription initiation factor TFIID TATA-box-binding protein
MTAVQESTDPLHTIELQNVVASSGIDRELDLERVATDLDGAEYDPDRAPGLLYRTTEPKATSLVFRSGKIVTTGASSIEHVHTAIGRVLTELDTLGIPVPDEPAITVQNVVASADLGQRLNLNAMAIGLGLEHVEYEPEQFPGLVYRLDEPSVVVLLFGSGKAVITGGKQPDDATEAIEVVISRLTELGLFERQ